ncbi:MAG: PHP domain-containing protein, partial [Alphaproteobacteria bacterium]
MNDPTPTSPAHANLRVPAMDMHVHTQYSDAKIKVKQLVEVAQRRRLGICICDHNEIRGSIQLWDSGEAATIPGIEIGSAERLEFLCYFPCPEDLEDYFVKYVEPYKHSRYYAKLDKSFTFLIPAAKELGALVCLPHPFAPGWKNFNFNRKRKEKLLDPAFLEQVDLIEVINSHMPDNRNFKAFLLSEILDKSVCAGSDAHRIQEVGAAYLSFGDKLNHKEIFNLLKQRIKVGSDMRFRFGRT